MQYLYANALKFIYTVTLKRPEVVRDIPHPNRPKTFPVILSQEEVVYIFGAIRSIKDKVIVATAYAAGSRISEVC
jgi:site-specific recombinase XerD